MKRLSHGPCLPLTPSFVNPRSPTPWTLPRKAWTMNVDAVEGSEDDSYR